MVQPVYRIMQEQINKNQNVCPIPEIVFLKKLILKKSQQMTTKHEQLSYFFTKANVVCTQAQKTYA